MAKCPNALAPTNKSGLCSEHRKLTGYCLKCAKRVKPDAMRCEECHKAHRKALSVSA